jgi:hypothetical protein
MQKENTMLPPVEKMKQYHTLYHSFTEAYSNANQVKVDFYPQAKRFVDGIAPEIDKYLNNLSMARGSATTPRSYEMVMNYMHGFDDFTISANKLFTNLGRVLNESEQFMVRIIDLKQNSSSTIIPGSFENYTNMIPELNDLLARLQQIPPHVDELHRQMTKLERDWKKTSGANISA